MRVLCLVGVLAQGFAPAAHAVAISNLSVAFDPGNTPDLFDNTLPLYEEVRSTVGVLSSSASGFTTRYQAGVFTDAYIFSTSNDITLNAAYTITFDVTDAVGTAWRLDLVTSRVGAGTGVDDGGPAASASAFSLSGVTGFLGGAGTLSAGSLGLPAIGPNQQTGSVDIAFNQSGTASISGSGNGTVTLGFAFTATAETIVAGGLFGQGDEAAIRMGIGDTLPNFMAGTYPGAPPEVPNRTAAADGHFIDLDLFDLGPIPEPDTALLLGLGLGVLAVQGRHRRSF